MGAEEGGGCGSVGEKLFMDQRTMQCSLAALENMRSPYQATLIGSQMMEMRKESKSTHQSTMSACISDVEKCG